MAAPSNAENRRINAQTQIPSRSAAAAGNAGRVPSAVEVLSINAEFPSISTVINHTRTDYVLAAVPTNWNDVIPDPHVGDRAFVFMVDSAQAKKPNEYREYHYTATSWRQVGYLT